jgi:naphtho-gamma-pyrone polyketide synthase
MKMLEKNEIPPHCGIKTKINHNFPTDMTDRDVHIALRPTPWRRPEYGNKKRLVFLNNFSAAGGNTALLLEDAPVRSSAYQSKDRNYQLVAVSGKSKLSLRKNLQALITFLVGNPKTSVQSLAYTTTARHLHHSHRVVVHGYELDSIIEGLKGKLSLCEEIKPVPVATKLPRVNFVFTGQGALYTRLAYALYKSNTRFRISLQRFDQIARKQGNPGFLGLIDGTIHTLDGVGPAITQVALTCVQIALAQLWMSWGVSPYAVVGHSLGEYAALQISSVLSANDAVFLVGTRARLLEDRCTAGTHCMLATNASLQTLGPYITGTTCEVACINGPNDTVLSGLIEEISPIAEALSVARIRCSKLDLPFAFHSSQVEAILPEFEAAAKSVSFNRPLIPFLSPLLGEVVTKSNILRPSYLSRASRESVNFRGALATAQDAGITSARDMWLEIGPHPVCSNMVKAILGPETFTIASLRRSCDDMKVIGESISDLHLAGINIRWSEYYYNSKDTDEVLQLPSYQWDTKNHWIQYRNNFCLAKGDPATDQEARKPEPEVASFSTSAIQRVIEQHIGKEKSTIVTESDVYEPSLFPTFQGHMVNGTPICTSVS